MQLQHVRGEVMEVKHPPNAAMIHGNGVTGLDNPREFTAGEGMREGQADHLLLDRDGHLGFDRRLPASMLQGASIQQTVEAIAPKPLPIPPQALVRQSSEVALLEEGPLALYDGTECLIAGSRVLIGGRVTRKQMELRRGGGCRWHRILPHAEETVMSRCRRTLCQKCCVHQDASFPTVRRLNRPNPYRRLADIP
jgi:hypothetical protein